MKSILKLIEKNLEDRFGKPSVKGFFGKAGAGVLAIAENTGRILLGKRSKDVDQPGDWGTIGGAFDGKEQPKKAAQREFEEETKYKGKMKLIPSFVFKKGDFKFHNFIGMVPEEFEGRPDWETDKLEWFEFNKLPRPLHFGVKELIKHSKSQIKKIIDEIR